MQTLLAALKLPFQITKQAKVLFQTPIQQYGLVLMVTVLIQLALAWLSPDFKWQEGVQGWLGAALSLYLTTLTLGWIGLRVSWVDLLKFSLASGLVFSVLIQGLLILSDPTNPELSFLIWLFSLGSLGAIIWVMCVYCKGISSFYGGSPWGVFWMTVLAGLMSSGLLFVISLLTGW
ncbi:hypothetical protein [Deinococcus cellulosilyticus]|uniref:Yip1 domain-containing protein n=1 Tax=Deinococcus cellulosilyticus (strain DSM 18568 / NBRC 106333 / KACC 11606 / 5516J-15) TaxID=1223518 RepID=A0A511MWN7_DEIC1|nr:hypothetical protein [Deinococcus cellulosilyticus]GEM44989.1 hypothetical protein DC3_06240 [Deinococcus cellulosilyticus NBRC 106333 = KACC 11606]